MRGRCTSYVERIVEVAAQIVALRNGKDIRRCETSEKMIREYVSDLRAIGKKLRTQLQKQIRIHRRSLRSALRADLPLAPEGNKALHI